MTQEEHRSTSRVLDILELLASADEQGYTLTEIAERIGAPKSSIFPIVHTLHNRRFLLVNPDTGRYNIGLGAFAIGSAFLDSQSLYEHIKEEMTAVVDSCSEICQMGVLDRNQVLYVAKVDSPESLRLISHVGKRLPLHCTALGKALILDYTVQELRTVFPEPDNLQRLTHHTVHDLDALVQQLESFRKCGITEECEESADSICCYAVPLQQEGRTVAALSVSIPLFRLDPQKTVLVKENLLKAKGTIERLLQESGEQLELLPFLDAK